MLQALICLFCVFRLQTERDALVVENARPAQPPRPVCQPQNCLQASKITPLLPAAEGAQPVGSTMLATPTAEDMHNNSNSRCMDSTDTTRQEQVSMEAGPSPMDTPPITNLHNSNP